MGDIKKLYNYLQSKKVQGLGSEDEFKDGFLNDSAFSQRVYDYVKPLFSDIEETRKAFVDGFREPKNNTAYATPVPYEKKKYYDPREDYPDWVDKQKQSFGNPPKDIDEAAVGIKKANNMELTPQEKSRERRAKVTEHVNANIGVERYNAYKEAEAQYRAAITSRLDADIERAKEAKRAKEEEIEKNIPQGSRALALFPQAKMAVQWTVPAYTLDILEDTKELLEAPTKGNNWAGSIWAGFRDNADMKSFLSLGMSTFAKTGKVYDICNRYTKGEALTDEETNLLEALAMNTAVAGLRAGDVSGWYRSGEVTGDMVEIMGQFLLTGGIGTGASKVVSKAIGKTMQKILPKVVSKMGAKGAVGTVLRGAKFAGKGAVDVVAGGAAQSIYMPSTYSGYWEKKSGTVTHGDKDGEYNIEPSKINDLQAMLSSMAETGTERLGGAFVGAGSKILKNIVPKSWAKLSTKGAIGALIKAGGTANKYMAKAGVNSTMGELSEEFAGAAFDKAIGASSDEEWKAFWSKDNMLQMIGGFAPMSMFGLGMNGATIANKRLSALRSKRKFVAFTREAGSKEGVKMAEDILNTPIEDLGNKMHKYTQEIGGYTDGELNDKGVEFNYFAAEMLRRSTERNIADEWDSDIRQEAEDNVNTVSKRTIDDTVDDRVDDTEQTIPQVQQGDEVEYDNARWIVGDVAEEDGEYTFGDESIPLKKGNVLMLEADGNGIRILESTADLYAEDKDNGIESRRQEIYEKYRPVMNVDTGNIIQLSSTADNDNIAYVVKGRVVYDEEGNIDYDKSDDTIYYKVYDKDGNEVDGGTPRPLHLKTHRTEFGKVLSDTPIEEYVDNELYPQDETEQSSATGSVSTDEYQEVTDENGLPFVKTSNGVTDFGYIPEDTGLTPAPIRLSIGDERTGLQHIVDRHGEQIAKAGFDNVVDFVEYVASNYDTITEGVDTSGEPNGTYLLQAKDKHNNTLYVELSNDGSYWNINSGGVFRKGYGEKNKVVWSASEVQRRLKSATPDTLRSQDEADNQGDPNRTVSDTTSTDKGTTNNLNIQNTVLDSEEADLLMSAMEQNAETMQNLELNYDNWLSEFGRDGIVNTPIGDVKMGDNQFLKMSSKERQWQFGMVRPTLTNPDIIIEEPSEARAGQATERGSSYLFVKTFDVNGEKIRHFESITVKKDGLEVSVSSHIIKPARLKSRLLNGSILWSKPQIANSIVSGEQQTLDDSRIQDPNANNHGSEVRVSTDSKGITKNRNTQNTVLNNKPELTSIGSDVYLTETHEGQSDLVPTQKANSDLQYKGTTNKPDIQEEFYNSLPKNKKGEIDESLMSAEQKIRYAQAEFGEDEELVKEYISEQSKALSEKIAKLTNKTGKSVAEFKELAALKRDKITFVEYLNEQRQQAAPSRAGRRGSESELGVGEQSEAGTAAADDRGRTEADIAEAVKDIDVEPTEAQKKAGNYKKGHVKIQGFDITIENPKGAIRKGVDDNGKAWSTEMKNHYGYFKNTEGKDGDHIDVFIGDNPNSKRIFVVDQVNPKTKEFDESKVMLGFDTEDEAKKAYLSNYSKDWKGFKDITYVDIDTFRDWLYDGAKQRKPFGEYSNIRFRSIKDINDRFNEELQQQIDGTLPKGHVYSLGMPNDILRSAGLPNLPIEMSAERLAGKSQQANHPFELSETESLPAAIQHPIAIFDSTKKDGSSVILTELKHGDSNFVAVLGVRRSDKQRKIDVEVNSIRSLYPKTHIQGIIDWFNSKDNLLRWVDKEKALNFISTQEPNYLAGGDNAQSTLSEKRLSDNETITRSKGYNTKDIAKVIKEFDNPTLSGEKNERIRLKASKRKAREATTEKLEELVTLLKKTGFADVKTGEDFYRKLAEVTGERRDVSTPKYRASEEKTARIEKLKKAKPIEITGDEYKGKYELNRDSAKSYIKDSLRGEYTNKDTGDTILLAKDGAQKVTSHSMGNEAHLKSIAVIPELIEKSIFIYELPNEKNNGKYDSYRYYVSGLKIGDVDYTVKLAIGVDEYGNKYYDHSLTQIEKGKLIDEVGALSTTLPSDNQSTLSEYKDKRLFSLLQTNSSKVVDENGVRYMISKSADVDKETDAIKERAISDGTFMKAPNGKDTNLTERQWLQVRTKAFKKWFGDWEKAYKLELIENLQPIEVDNIGLSRERAEEEYKKIGTSKTNRYDNRRIEFVNNAFGKIARHKNSALILDIIPQLNDLFESAIPIYFEEEREPLKSTNIVGSHNYLGKVRVNDEDYYVRITAQELTPSWKQNEKQGKSNFHNMAVSDIAIYDESGSSVTAKDYSIDNDNRNRFVDAKLQHFFETAREARKNSSKAVDENGEPKVFYHNTDNEFYAFDSSKNGTKNDAGWLGDGFYFYGDENEGDGYGREKKAVFLKVRDPYYATSEENDELAEANSRERSIEFREDIESEGYDGVYYNGDLRQEAVAFYPSQIKSATDNIGTFNEEDEDIRYMRPNGTVLGFVKGNTIYLNPDEVSLNTPIHEFGHLWVSQVKEHFPDLWEKGKELFLESDYLRKVQADPNYRHLDLDGQIDEAMARAIGDRGEQELDKTLLEKILDWIAEVWEKIGGVFGIDNLTSEQISNLTLQDFTDMATSELLSGQNLTERVNGNRGGATRYNTAEETADIKAKAISDGTFMKAPNGKDTNLTERQWLQVRTKAFKKWFGDWEKTARIEKLKKTKPIEITGEEYKGKYELNVKSGHKWILDNLRGTYTIKDTGEKVNLSRVSANEITSHGEREDIHLKSFAVIPQMIENAIFIDETDNYKSNNKYDKYKYYVVGLNVGGVPYTARIVVGEKNGKTYYDHELTQIEKGTIIDSLNGTTTSVAKNANAFSEYKDNRLFSLLQTNSSKVVDENGEPMVVYHGTNENFNIFDKKKAGSGNDKGLRGKGFYLSPNQKTSEAYGGRVISAYISLKHPFNPSEFASAEEVSKHLTNRLVQQGYDEYTVDSSIFNVGYSFSVGNEYANVFSSILKEAGYDGVLYPHRQEVITFDSHQIKSATDNIGTFNEEDEDIRYSVEGADYFVNERFNEQLEKLTEENADSTIFYLGEPSAEMLAVGIKDSPLKLYGNKLQSKAKKHGFDVKDIKDLPEAIHDPIAIFEGAEDGSFAILTELSVGDNNVLATLSVGKGNDVDFNIVSSVYGKYNKNVVGWINKGKTLYVNKEKALDYLRISAPIAEAQDKGELNPSVSTEKTLAWQAALAPIASATLKQELITATKVIENFENPPINEKKVIDDTTNDMVRYSIKASEQLDKEDEVMGERAAEIYEARVKMGKQMNQSNPNLMPNKKIFDEINEKTENRRAKIAEHAADCYLPMKHLIEIFNKHGYNIADYNNWYMNVFALAGKNEAEYEKYQAERSVPLQRAAKAAMDSGQISYRELENYLILKHGQERNKYYKERDEKLGVKPMKDYSGTEAVMFEEFCKRTGIKVKTIEEDIPTLVDGDPNMIRYDNGKSEFSKDGKKIPDFEVNKRFELWRKQHTPEEIIEDYEEKIGKEKVEDLWGKIRKATQFTLDCQKEGGLTSEDMYKKASGMWEYFVPLRGFDMGTAQDEYDYDLNGITLFTDFRVEQTLGRTRRSVSPLAWTEQMAHITIQQKNKNLLNQSLRRLASVSMARKDNIMFLSKQYKASDVIENGKVVREGALINPPAHTGNPTEDSAAFERWETSMKEGVKNGTVEVVEHSNVNFGMIVSADKVKQHVVRVYEGGRPVDIIFNTSPSVPRAINGLNNKTVVLNDWFSRQVKAGTRLIAQTMTTYNPAFVGKNFMRDYLFANTMLMGKEDRTYRANFNKNIVKAHSVMFDYVKGKSLLGWAAGDKGSVRDNEYGRLLTEFVMNGGKTGFSQMFKFEKMSSDFKKQTERGDKTIHYGINDYIHFIEAMNDYAENITRFSAYCASRQAGRSIERSISDAKELTINFNRKGIDGGAWGVIRSLSAFSNASIQALVVFSRGVRANPKRLSAIISSYVAMPIAMAIVASLVGGDDYFKLSKYDRQNNICIPMFGGGFIKIPLPQELRVFWKLGDEIALCIYRNEPPEVAAQEVFMGALDLLPSFAAGATSISDVLDEKIGAGELLLAHQPITILQPITQIMANRNFLNYRIYDDNKWGGRRKELPEYRKALRNKGGETYSPNFAVKLSEGISRLTGGSDLKRGLVEANPDMINHLMRGYFGGLYSSAVAAINMGDKGAQSIAAGEMKMKTTDSPTMKAFYVSPSNLRYTDDILNARYMDVLKEAKKHANVYANYLKEGEVDRFEKETKMTEDEALDWRYLVKTIDKEVQELRNEIATAETTKERDEALRQLEALQREAIDMAVKLKK